MLAKNVNDNAYFLNQRGACEFFASKLAPTVSGRIRASPPVANVASCQQPVEALSTLQCNGELAQECFDVSPIRFQAAWCNWLDGGRHLGLGPGVYVAGGR
ncbi:hypothetical protein CRN80_05210 [Pseudomonas sp. FDAARGOS_380]|nr:hypothetical protein CRN80_05210 [Pseudomonas sp. FDAARGOS_380]